MLLSPISGYLTSSNDSYDYLVTELVKRGVFQVTVTEKGTVDSLRNATLFCKVEGATPIISIVPEGTEVKEGDIVCELDSSVLVDKETQQQINVTQAKAALATAEEEVAIQEAQNDTDIKAAELTKDLAKIDVKKFKLGDFVQQKMELDTQVKINRENISRANEFLSFLERLVRKGYRMQSDLDAERIAYSKALTDKDVAEEKLRVLKEYTYPRTERELDAKLEEADRQIFRAQRKADAAMAQKLADREAKSLTYDVQSSLLKRLQTQIANCKITAPKDGQVVYANAQNGRSSESILIEVGASVRERQPIINLPDLDAMKVNARIHESRISMVRPGLSAIVKIDAKATEDFHGEVDTVASVPSSLNSFNRDLKEYEAVVRLTDDVSKINELRPGLTATVEILVSQRDDVLQTPVQSLISLLEKRFVYVLGPNGPELKEIKIGETNERTVEILEGLNEGDRVIMNPRTQFSKEIGELEAKLSKERAQHPVDAPQKSPSDQASPAKDAPKPSPGGGPGPKAGEPGGDSAGPPRQNPLARFQSMDQNHDGKLTVDEVSDERMKSRFDMLDADHNGSVDQQEFVAAMSRFARRGGGPPGGGSGAPGGGN